MAMLRDERPGRTPLYEMQPAGPRDSSPRLASGGPSSWPSAAPARALLPWLRLGAYTGAGVISGIANVALFHALVHARWAPHLAWIAAFEVGALLAFVLHRHVTWRDRRVRTLIGVLRQLWRAQAGSVAALVLNLAVFSTLIHAGLPDDVDDAAGLVAGFALNYALARHFIYGSVRYGDGWYRTRRP